MLISNQFKYEISLHLGVPSKCLSLGAWMGYVILLWHSLSLPYNYFLYLYLYKAVSSDLLVLLTCIMSDFKHDLESVMVYMTYVNFKSVSTIMKSVYIWMSLQNI